MKLLEIMAKDWAENNTSPGTGGRDELYEILIECQKQAYEAGFNKALKIASTRGRLAQLENKLVDSEILSIGEEVE